MGRTVQIKHVYQPPKFHREDPTTTQVSFGEKTALPPAGEQLTLECMPECGKEFLFTLLKPAEYSAARWRTRLKWLKLLAGAAGVGAVGMLIATVTAIKVLGVILIAPSELAFLVFLIYALLGRAKKYVLLQPDGTPEPKYSSPVYHEAHIS